MAVEHVVVLCLENRSFDHMLGFLDHPAAGFAGLGPGGPWSNPDATGRLVPASPDATQVLPCGPDHSHDAVMQQLALSGPPWNRVPSHQGFVASYERKAAGQHPPRYTGLLSWLDRLRPRARTGTSGRGPLVMRCQAPHRVPVLATLATEFAVFDHWFCSVPGETWPNRNFLHAATSDGETNIVIRPYTDPTIFELLEQHGHDWRIYHDGTAQAMAFPRLWDTPARHANWHPVSELAAHVAAGDLPSYTFIEPRHQPPPAPLNQLQDGGRPLGASDSQHPENNLVDDAAFDTFVPTSPTDFDRGETLVAGVYEALRGNPELFATTILLITYDEHGGLYDHLPALERVPAPGTRRSLSARILDAFYRESAGRFDFTRLGVRVPTLVVSPLVGRGVLVSEVFEHASVPATLRAVFAPDAAPLTRRDAHARTFHHLWDATPVRTDLPDLSGHARPRPGGPAAPPPAEGAEFGGPQAGDAWTPSYYREFLAQADAVRRHLRSVGEPEAAGLDSPTTRRNEAALDDAFARAARRHRRQPG